MNPLFRLINDNRAVKGARRYEVVPTVIDGAQNKVEEATIYLYDFIVGSKAEAEWWGGVAAETFVKDLRDLDAPVIHLRINSPGGDMFAARAMEQAVRDSKAKIIAHVDGYAASAATYVALAANEVEINEGGFFMIHNAWTIGMGNASDFRKTAEVLDQLDTTIVNTYAKRTKLDADALRAMMAEESWINAEDSVKHGFADRIAEGEVEVLNWNLSSLLQNSLNNKARAAESISNRAAEEAATVARQRAERLLHHLERNPA